MHPTKNDLPEATRTKLCGLLNSRLADAIDLGLQAKQAHWNVKDPHFYALHRLFDEIAGELSTWMSSPSGSHSSAGLPKERWAP